MKSGDKFLQFSLGVLGICLLFQLAQSKLPQKFVQWVNQPQVTTAMLFLQTGRIAQFPEPTTPAATEPAPTQPLLLPTFTADDAALVQITNASGYAVDVASLLEMPLQWDAAQDAPLVLILHTHGSEAFSDCIGNGVAYRSLNETENMLAIGDRLAQQLEAAGIGVIHDRTIHDHPSYDGAYNHSRKQTQAYLEQYPSIMLVLDIHRDAMADRNGKQMSTSVNINGTDTGQLMLVIGTNSGGLYHPQWKENMALAVKLHTLLAKVDPNLIRPISLRSQRFNQDLSPGALLIEVGTAGNTLAQAMAASDQLGAALIALTCGLSPH